MKQVESFFWGIVAAFGALMAELLIFGLFPFFAATEKRLDFALQDYSGHFLFFLAATALIEELFKYIVIAKRLEALFMEKSLFFNSFLVGIGFSFTEIFLIQKNSVINWSSDYQNVLGIALIHIATAGIMGYFLTVNNPRKIKTFLKAIFTTFCIHFSYNALTNSTGWNANYIVCAFFVLLLIANVVCFIRIKKQLAF